MFMTGVLCTICGAQVYFHIAGMLAVLESSLIELERSLIQLKSAGDELVPSQNSTHKDISLIELKSSVIELESSL